MASKIEQFLNKILSSRYGKDVRQAIHDGIHQCYEDGKAGAVDLVAREQITNLISNVPEGSEKDSELVDIRVLLNGIKFNTAGDAVRYVDKIALESMGYSLSLRSPYTITEFQEGYYHKTGHTVSTSDAKRTDYIPIQPFMKILETYTSLNQDGCRIAFFDSNKNFLSDISITGESTNDVIRSEVDLTSETYSNARYFMVSSYRTDPIVKIYASEDKYDIKRDIYDIKRDIYSRFPYTITEFQEGYYHKTGHTVSTSDAKRTDYIPIQPFMKILETYTSLNQDGCRIAFFDSNKNFLSDISITGESTNDVIRSEVDLTSETYSNARYFMVSSYRTDPIVKIYASEDKYDKLAKHYNTFSILGDSYSTFDGYVKDPSAVIWYPAQENGHSNNDVNNVEKTWWHIFATRYGSRLIENVSYSGSTISYNGYNPGIDDNAKETSFITRANQITTPELILVFGGTNDCWAATDTGTVDTFLGDYKYSNFTDEDLKYTRPALAYLLKNLIDKNIGSKIVFILNTGLIDNFVYSVRTICKYYNVSLLELHDISKGNSHPNIDGMNAIAEQLIDFIKTYA